MTPAGPASSLPGEEGGSCYLELLHARPGGELAAGDVCQGFKQPGADLRMLASSLETLV